jgi:hypothetical protein
MEEISRDPWDSNYLYYPQLADLLNSVAHEHCGVEVDETTLLRWRDLMGIMREIDTQADDSGVDHDEILRQMESFERFEERYPHITPDAIGQETFSQLLMRTRKILKLGEQVARATTDSRYVKLRAGEALHTAEVFRDSATHYVVDQSAFGNSFMPLLRRMAVLSCFIDSAHDLKKDYAEGKSVLQPLYRTRLTLALKAIGMSARLLPAALHREVLIQTIEAARMQYQRKSH